MRHDNSRGWYNNEWMTWWAGEWRRESNERYAWRMKHGLTFWESSVLVAKPKSKTETLQMKIEVDTTELDAAIAKADELKDKLKKLQFRMAYTPELFVEANPTGPNWIRNRYLYGDWGVNPAPIPPPMPKPRLWDAMVSPVNYIREEAQEYIIERCFLMGRIGHGEKYADKLVHRAYPRYGYDKIVIDGYSVYAVAQREDHLPNDDAMVAACAKLMDQLKHKKNSIGRLTFGNYRLVWKKLAQGGN